MSNLAAPSDLLGGHWRAMLAGVLLLIASGTAWAQHHTPTLARLVRLAPGTRPLGAILAELARQGNLPLSYSSSLVPVARPYTQRPSPARPLGMVLQEVLAAEHLSCGMLAGQLVLWPARVAAPVGIAVIDDPHFHQVPSRASRVGKLPTGPPVAPNQADALAPATGSHSPASRPSILAGPRALSISSAAAPGRASVARPAQPGGKFHPADMPAMAIAPRASKGFLAQQPPGIDPKTPPASTALVGTARRLKATKLPLRPPLAAGQQPSNRTATSTRVRDTQSRADAGPKGHRTEPEEGATTSPATAHRSGQLRGEVAALSFLRSMPAAVPAGPVRATAVLTSGTTIRPTQGMDTAVIKPATGTSILLPSYLHGEAWGSESLALGATAKVGIPRLYLVMGVAAGPPGPQSGGVAWGGGLGTAAAPRGRFTPSLDVVHWFVSGDRETSPSSLTQLRPQVGWQLRPGGRWQLLGGPTLNLAIARRRGPPPQRWDFGRDQWLWLNQLAYESSLRLWPGVQIGLRF